MPGYHLPYFTGAAQGLYERHGLDVEIVYPEPGVHNIRAVAAGRYDVCLTSIAHFLNAKSVEPELGARFVFMVAWRSHMAVFSIEGRPAAHGRPVRTFHDLEGASFLGTPDSPFTREYVGLMRHLRLSPGPAIDVAYPDVMDALARGDGDVTADHLDLAPAFEKPARAHGVGVAAMPFYRAGLDVYGSGLVAGESFSSSHPDALRALVAAVRDSMLATRSDPRSGIEALLARFPDADRKRAVAGWSVGAELMFDDDERLGEMDTAKWERTIVHHAQTHGTPLIDPASVFSNSFLDPEWSSSGAPSR